MASAEFEGALAEVASWITHYRRDVETYPVLARVEPGDLARSLPSTPSDAGMTMDEVLTEFRELIVPGLTHWNHPSFFGYFSVTGSGPGVLGEVLAAALNVNAMVWRASPAGTELEETATAWLRAMLGLPDEFRGVINDTASSSTLYALAAARETYLPESREGGLTSAPPGRIYVSDQAHSSVTKAVHTLGFGRHGVHLISSDEDFQMDVVALERAVIEDRQAGLRPLAVVGTLGTTSTTGIDPMKAIGDIAARENLWFHVDAAYGGPAAIVNELRSHFDGWERADSIVVNPHKWLFTPLDCSILYCRRPEALRAAFSLTPDYLQSDEEGSATNLMDYGVPLGRRFRALKLWFVMRYFGRSGLAERIRTHCALASEFASWVDEAHDWERVAPVPFGTVAFRFAPDESESAEIDRLNQEILEWVNRDGRIFITHTVLNGSWALRLSIGNLATRREHVVRAWEVLQEAVEAIT